MVLKKVSLQDAFWFQEGPGVRKWQFTNAGIKLLNVGNITKEGLIDLSKTDRYLSEQEVKEKYRHFLCEEGDLVIASSGISFDDDGLLRTRGAFIKKDHLPLCMNTSTIRFKSKKDVSDLNFLKFWLDSHEFREQISRQVTGSAQQNFGPMQLRDTWINLPPLPEQKRIASLLARADRLRRLRRYARQLGDTYLQSVFVEMFGDPVTNSRQWELHRFEYLTHRITKGESPRWQGFSYESRGVYFYTSENVLWGQLDISNPKYISEKFHKKLKRSELFQDDLLLNIVGASIGRAAIVHKNYLPANVNQAVAVITLDKGKLLPEFTLHQILSPQKQKKLLGNIVESARANISLTNISELEIIVPPMVEQERFARVVSRYERLRAQQAEAERQSEGLFQSLLAQAFGGA
jgi:type I restriction enzyme S subunit